MKAEYQNIGQSIPKIGVTERLRGEPIFSADLAFDDVLVLKVLRSVKAHANLVNIDFEEALNGQWFVSDTRTRYSVAWFILREIFSGPA